ncbi:hypothetical protein [Mycoplasma sp. 1654_15]|uniref:hypothetical protein n=1 Tax=Mycoplasma sp. 1654_15 TaxID=2725994 RepID=UPI0014493A21|nr:hypothetical protein [Mycoplasma sp. 1654_15]QJB71042.1 hypothetical protein HF996_00735 [Mycoplasma sp. 1654_15]
MNKRKIVCYHILGDAINHYFIEETKNVHYDAGHFKDDNTKDGAFWRGNYLIKTKDKKVYIGTGRYIERIKSHIKEKEWGRNIEEIFIWTLDQEESIPDADWFKFVEKDLIERCQSKKWGLNKIDGVTTHLAKNFQNSLIEFIKKTQLIFKAFNLFPFEVPKLTSLSQDKKDEEKTTTEKTIETQNNYINEDKNTHNEQQKPTTYKIVSSSVQGNIKQLDSVTRRQTNEEKRRKEDWFTQYLQDNPNIILVCHKGSPIIQIINYINKDDFKAIVKKDSLIWDINKRDLFEKTRSNIQEKRNKFSKEYNVNLSTGKLEKDVYIKNKSLNYIIEVFYGQMFTKYELKTLEGISLNKLYEKHLEKNQNIKEKEEKTITENSIETQNEMIFSFPFKKPDNTYTKIKDWIFEFFKLNQGITLTYISKRRQIEILIKEFKNNDDNTIIVKKGSYIKPLNVNTENYKKLHRIRVDVFEAAKILEKYEINSEKHQELQEDVEIIDCSVNKILSAFSGKKPGNDEIKIKNDNKTLRDYFEGK